jgi:hypothetical protein
VSADQKYVTNAELKEELDRLPTRWEMRFLILAGMIASQIIPASDIAQAAFGMLP